MKGEFYISVQGAYKMPTDLTTHTLTTNVDLLLYSPYYSTILIFRVTFCSDL